MAKIPQGPFYRSLTSTWLIPLRRYISDCQIQENFSRRSLSECILLILRQDSKTNNSLNSSRTKLYGSENVLLFKRSGVGLFSGLPIEQHDLYVKIMRRICASRQSFQLGRGHPFHYFRGSGVALRIDASTALVDTYREILEDLQRKISIKGLAVKRPYFKSLYPFQYHLSADEINNTITNLVSKWWRFHSDQLDSSLSSYMTMPIRCR
jgi:hypothetical protein